MIGLGLQLGVGNLDDVTPVQLGERGPHLGQVASLLVQRQGSSSRAAAWSWEESGSSTRTTGGPSG